MLSSAQLQKIWLLSDTLLYQEAVEFMRKFTQEQGCDPLPSSQANGLLGIAEASSYDELYHFVIHQRDRDWQPSKRDIKTFYTNLEQVLSQMLRRRLREEFHLLSNRAGQSIQEIRDEANALMALLAHEFIQHLVAENGLQLTAREEKRRHERQQKPGRR